MANLQKQCGDDDGYRTVVAILTVSVVLWVAACVMQYLIITKGGAL